VSARRVAGLVAALVLAGCTGAGAGSQASESRREVRAPIVRVTLRVAESHPPQYFADIVSALPDGCARFSRFSVRRDGAIVFVDVFNTVPADETLMCSMIYGEHESVVPLGSDFRPGVHYTLEVNGTRQRLTSGDGV